MRSKKHTEVIAFDNLTLGCNRTKLFPYYFTNLAHESHQRFYKLFALSNYITTFLYNSDQTILNRWMKVDKYWKKIFFRWIYYVIL